MHRRAIVLACLALAAALSSSHAGVSTTQGASLPGFMHDPLAWPVITGPRGVPAGGSRPLWDARAHSTLHPADPSALLISASDLPAGYVSDDILENVDATARSRAYAGLIVRDAFAGYRLARAGVVEYVALFRSGDDAHTFLGGETSAVARTKSALALSVPTQYGDSAVLAYQDSGGRGEQWVSIAFADGPYAAVLSAFDAASEQAAFGLLEALAARVDARMRAAARAAANGALPPKQRNAGRTLTIVSLQTTSAKGRPKASFSRRGSVYWTVLWRLSGRLPARKETIREVLRGPRGLILANSLTDRPFEGDNVVDDHVKLSGDPAGSYSITVSISIGRLTASARRGFTVT